MVDANVASAQRSGLTARVRAIRKASCLAMPIGGMEDIVTSNTAGPSQTTTTRVPKLRDFLRIMIKENASDLVLKANGCPAVRVTGVIRFLGDQQLSGELLRSYIDEILTERGQEDFKETGATDIALAVPGIGRFRCNAFHQCGELGLVFRAIKTDIPSFKDLNLPVEPLKRLSSLKRGLVLATGVAGSGKSTTFAAMIEYVNRTMNKHIITIEDPIEFRSRRQAVDREPA
jgi:Tfp pilus assembly pilus retraction ATPase PilT